MNESIHTVCPHCGKTNRLPAARAGQHPDCGACGQPLFPGKPVEVGDARFDDYLRRTDLPVVVDFWAAWCGPCRAIAPIIDDLAGEYEGRATIAKVDVDNNPKVAMEYGIRSIPTLLVFKGGRVVDTIVGAVPKNFITDKLNAQLS